MILLPYLIVKIENWNKFIFKTLIQFSLPILEIRESNLLNKTLLSLFDVSNIFHNNI